MTTTRAVLLCAGAWLLAAGSQATVEMEVQARKLGFPAANCLYCHATPHAVEAMKQKAKALNINEGNCLACHGANIPAKLNARGHWLLAEKQRRGAKQLDMAWLREYKEASPSPAPPVARHAKP
jgi:mono/diheme cytochrome c family protein